MFKSPRQHHLFKHLDSVPMPESARRLDRVQLGLHRAGVKIDEEATTNPTAKCNTLYPLHDEPRMVAGAVLTNDVLVCTLKPISVPLSTSGEPIYEEEVPADRRSESLRAPPQARCGRTHVPPTDPSSEGASCYRPSRALASGSSIPSRA